MPEPTDQDTSHSTGPHTTPATVLRTMANAGITTGVMHPWRVVQVRANFSNAPSVIDIIRDARPRMTRGFFVNNMRGMLTVSSQLLLQQHARDYFGADTLSGRMAAIWAPALGGAVVGVTFESYFDRAVMRTAEHALKPMVRVNFPVFSLLLTRELGFCGIALGMNQPNSPADWLKTAGIFASVSWFTAAANKLASVEATRDFLKPGVTAPDFKQGVAYTFRSMAYGGVYTHPAFQVRYPNPATYAQLAKNLAHVACHRNLFLIRFGYMMTYKSVLLSVRQIPDVTPSMHAFFKKNEEAVSASPTTPPPSQKKNERP